MKYFAVILMMLFSVNVMAAEQFLPGTEDVPLMDGLVVQSTDDDVSFDTPAGQILIVQAVARNKTVKDVMDFYEDALMSLGWVQKGADKFERAGQELTVNIRNKARSVIVVRFELSPVES